MNPQPTRISLANVPTPPPHQDKGGYKIHARPPWIEPPASAEPFSPTPWSSMISGGAGDQGTTLTLLSLQVPLNRAGVIWQIGFGGSEPTGNIPGWTNGSGALLFTLQINNKAVQNFANLRSRLGLVDAPRMLAAPIRLRPNDLVQFIMANQPATANPSGVVAGGQLVGLTLGGYFYPYNLEPTFRW